MLSINEKILDTLKGEHSDLFIAKFLRSQRGFELLRQEGWLQLKLREWREHENEEYILRLERSIYEGLNMNQLNSQVQTYAMQIWIPIYEHSNDFRNELMLLKRYPFQVQIKVENLQNEVLVQETLQTYIECDNDNQLQIIGKVVNKHSKLYGLCIENYYYMSVCMRLGATYVDARANESKDPVWTMVDVNDKNKAVNGNKFRIFKNGVQFQFSRCTVTGDISPKQGRQQEDESKGNLKNYLDSVVFKVQILPQKYRIIKTPIHLYGELVKTEEGACFLNECGDLDYFK